MRWQARWYHGGFFSVGNAERIKTVPWQTNGFARRQDHSRRPRLPEEIARLAYEEYANQGHGGQSFDRLHERGGFGVTEVICLLADLVERERASHHEGASGA